MSDITFKMTVATNVGLVRTNNEDNFIVNPDLSKPDNWFVPSGANEKITLGEYGCVMVVADGMGGMNAGEVASEIAVNSIKNSFAKIEDYSKITDCSNHVEAFLKKAIVDADSEIKKKVKEDPSTAGMGTTVVMAWIIKNVAHVAWCGDSRAYLFNRQGSLSRLSKDHSYVQELVDSGRLDEDLAFDHPNSNIITRSLGDSAVKAQPDYVSKRLSAGDYVILCTDGLCGLVRDEETFAILMQEHDSIEEYRNALFNAAFAAGGYDNVTIAMLECLSVQEEVLTTTLLPHEVKKKKTKDSNKTNKVTESKKDEDPDKEGKSRKVSKIWLVVALVLLAVIILFALALCFDVITFDAVGNVRFNLKSLKL